MVEAVVGMLHLQISESHADVLHPAQSAPVGRYHYRDAFKPYLHPLRTPRGHVVTLASPHDHRHHKGLMYALTAEQANFWEEQPSQTHDVVGRMVHVAFEDVVGVGDEVGFGQTLRWVYGPGDQTLLFDELREIRCRFDVSSRGYVWTWRTRLTARADTRLRKSFWAWKLPGGRFVNYHGLGIRMRRDFGHATGGNKLLLDGRQVKATNFEDPEAMGTTPREATYVGSIDETLPVERASVTIRQDHGHGLFVLNQLFAWMSVGPSNLQDVHLTAGQMIDERYEVVVADAE